MPPLLLGWAGPSSAADLLDEVRSKGELLIGTSNDAPLSFVDPQTQQAAGVLPDILREFLVRAGVKAELRVVAMPFNSLIPSIQSSRIQLIGDAMYVRPARREVVDFTVVTFYNPESLDVVPGNPKTSTRWPIYAAVWPEATRARRISTSFGKRAPSVRPASPSTYDSIQPFRTC